MNVPSDDVSPMLVVEVVVVVVVVDDDDAVVDAGCGDDVMMFGT